MSITNNQVTVRTCTETNTRVANVLPADIMYVLMKK